VGENQVARQVLNGSKKTAQPVAPADRGPVGRSG